MTHAGHRQMQMTRHDSQRAANPRARVQSLKMRMEGKTCSGEAHWSAGMGGGITGAVGGGWGNGSTGEERLRRGRFCTKG